MDCLKTLLQLESPTKLDTNLYFQQNISNNHMYFTIVYLQHTTP